MSMPRHSLDAYWIALLLFSAISSFAQQTVQSRVNPQVVTKGQQATYEVILPSGGGNRIGGVPPRVPGLEISHNVSYSTSTRIINGNVSRSVTYGFPVRGLRTGTFTIPAWVMEVGGKKFNIQPAALKVVDAGEVYKDVFQLSLILPQKEVYVGQRMEGTLRLLVREGVSVRVVGAPEKDGGDGFTLEPLKQDSWSINQTQIGGIRYDQGTVALNLTPIKSGPQSLKFTQIVSVRVRSRDPLNDFFGRGSEKQIPLETEAINVNIKPLPTADKPQSFSGAVGSFEAVAEASPSEVRVGEPVTLTYRVSGSGSFDRIQAPALDGANDFKVYPPKIDFQPGSSVKSFEYLVIPQREGTGELLEVPFSYFDPEKGTYVDLSRRPMAISVLPPPEGTDFEVPTQVAKTAETGNRKSNVGSGVRLLDIRLEPGRWQIRGEAMILTPVFIGTQVALLGLFSGLFIVRRKQLLLAGDADLRRRIAGGKAASKWRQEAESAASNGDAALFLDAALRAVQESVGSHNIDSEASALTFGDVHRHLEKNGADEDVIKAARDLFEAGDLLKFGGAHTGALDLPSLLKSLNQLEEALK